MKKLIQEAVDKLNNRVIIITEQAGADTLKPCDIDYNKAFIKGAQKSALKRWLVSILNNSSGIKNSFGKDIPQVSTASKSLALITLAIASGAAVMDSIFWFAARNGKQEVEQSVRGMLFTPTALPSFGLDSSSKEARKICKDRRSKRNLICRKSSTFSLNRKMLSLKRTTIKAAKWFQLSTTRSDAEDRARNLEVLHASDSHFQIVVEYKTYRLQDESQIYDGKIASSTVK